MAESPTLQRPVIGGIQSFPSMAESPPLQPSLGTAARIIHNTLAQPDFPVLATAVTPDSRFLATGGYRIVHIWDRRSGHLHQTWQASTSWIRTLAFSPNGHLLAAGGDAGAVHLLDWEKHSPLPSLQDSGGTVYGIAFSPDGVVLASGAADHGIRLWDVTTGQMLKQLQGHQTAVRGVAFSPDGSSLVSGSQDGTVNRWNVLEAIPIARPFKGSRDGVYSVAFSPDGHWIAAGEFRTIHLWNAITGKAHSPLKKHTSWIRSLAFSADSSQLASVSDEGVLYVWRIVDGGIQERWAGHQAPAFSVSFIRDQEWISAGDDGRILIWQQGITTPVWSLLGYPDGRWITCKMVGHRQCWQPGESQQGTPEEPSVPSEPFPTSDDGLSWHEWGSILVAIVTLVAVFWQRILLLPVREYWSVILPKFRERFSKAGLLRPPSPTRFARRVGGRVDFSVPNNRHMARICMAADFPLPVTALFYVRVQPGQVLEKIPAWFSSATHSIKGLDAVNEVAAPRPLLLLVGVDGAQRDALRPVLYPLDCLWIMPDAGELTRLLLAVQPRQALSHLLAEHLDPVVLSPYQTDGPIEKASLYFGRQGMLERLVQQGHRNHLLIGGQGMGKTSLLLALARKYRHHPVIRAALFSPVQGDVVIPLAQFLSYQSASLDRLLDELASFPDRKKSVLLIDDADAFLATDAARHFATLERLAHLSAQGCCHTILTGSWAVQRLLHGPLASSLRNWVDVHPLGPLEVEVSWNMVRKPMAWIHREWDAGVCLELIQSSGGRPDWTMALCHAVLKQLGPQDKKITQYHLGAALISQDVGEYLDRWPTLLSDLEEEHRQDRLLVYSCVKMDPFSHGELLTILQKKYSAFFSAREGKAGHGSPDEQLQRALDRLQLACILRRAGGQYEFVSKLLRTRILQQHPEDRLKKGLHHP